MLRLALELLARRRPRKLGRTDESRLGLEQHERECALGVGRGEERGHRSAVDMAEQCGRARAYGIQDRAHVVHPLLERGRAGDAIGRTDPTLVEDDDARGRAELTEDLRLPPPTVDRGCVEAADDDELVRPAAAGLVRNVDVAALRVLRVRKIVRQRHSGQARKRPTEQQQRPSRPARSVTIAAGVKGRGVTDAESFVAEFVAAIRAEDADRYASLYAEDAELVEPLLAEPLRGRDAIRAGEAELFAAFGDVDAEVISVVVKGRRVAVEVVLRALNDGPLDLGDGEPLPPTRRRIEVPMAWFFELDDAGRIARERDYFDTAAILRQLGVDQSER